MASDLSSGCTEVNDIFDDEKEEGEISLDDVSSSEDGPNYVYGSSTFGQCPCCRSMHQCPSWCRKAVNANARSKKDAVQEKENRHHSKDSTNTGIKPTASTLQEKNDDLVPISSDSDMELVGIVDKFKESIRKTKAKKKKKKKSRISSAELIANPDSLVDLMRHSSLKENHSVKSHRSEESTSFRSKPSTTGSRLTITKTCIKRLRPPTERARSPCGKSRSPTFRAKSTNIKKSVKNEIAKKSRSPRKSPHRCARSISKKSVKKVTTSDVDNLTKLLKKVRRLESTKSSKEQGSSLKEKLSNIIKKSSSDDQSSSELKEKSSITKACVDADDEDDIALLRQIALKTKQAKSNKLQELPTPVPVTNKAINDEDEEDLNLRMIALRSAVLKKHRSRVELGIKNQKKKEAQPVNRAESPFSASFLNDLDLDETDNTSSNLQNTLINESRDIIMSEDMELDSDNEISKEIEELPYLLTDNVNQSMVETESAVSDALRPAHVKRAVEDTSAQLQNTPNSFYQTINTNILQSTEKSNALYTPSDPTETPEVKKQIHGYENLRDTPLSCRQMEPRSLSLIHSELNIPCTEERPYSPTDVTVYDPDLPGLCSAAEITFLSNTSGPTHPLTADLGVSSIHNSNVPIILHDTNLSNVSKSYLTKNDISPIDRPLSMNTINHSTLLSESFENINEMASLESPFAPEIVAQELGHMDLDGSPLVPIDKVQHIRNATQMIDNAPAYVQNLPEITKDGNKIPTIINRILVPSTNTTKHSSQLTTSTTSSQSHILFKPVKLNECGDDNMPDSKVNNNNEGRRIISPNSSIINNTSKQNINVTNSANEKICGLETNFPSEKQQKINNTQNEGLNVTDKQGEKQLEKNNSQTVTLNNISEIASCNVQKYMSSSSKNISTGNNGDINNSIRISSEHEKRRLSLDEDEDALREALLASIIKKPKLSTHNVNSSADPVNKSSTTSEITKRVEKTPSLNKPILRTVNNQPKRNVPTSSTKPTTTVPLVRKSIKVVDGQMIKAKGLSSVPNSIIKSTTSNVTSTSSTYLAKKRPITSSTETSPRKIKRIVVPISTKVVRNAKRYQILNSQRKLIMQKTTAAVQKGPTALGNRSLKKVNTIENVRSSNLQTSVHSDQHRIVINLRSDTDSDSEVEQHKNNVAITMNRSSVDKRPVLNVPQTDFEKSVDQLLRDLRAKQEMTAANVEKPRLPPQKISLKKTILATDNTDVLSKEAPMMPPKSSVQPSPKSSSKPPPKPITKEIVEASKLSALGSTPLAVRHLPISKQEEYRRLKQEIFKLQNKILNKTNEAALSPKRNAKKVNVASNPLSPVGSVITTTSKSGDTLINNTPLKTPVIVTSALTVTITNNLTRSVTSSVKTVSNANNVPSLMEHTTTSQGSNAKLHRAALKSTKIIPRPNIQDSTTLTTGVNKSILNLLANSNNVPENFAKSQQIMDDIVKAKNLENSSKNQNLSDSVKNPNSYNSVKSFNSKDSMKNPNTADCNKKPDSMDSDNNSHFSDSVKNSNTTNVDGNPPNSPNSNNHPNSKDSTINDDISGNSMKNPNSADSDKNPNSNDIGKNPNSTDSVKHSKSIDSVKLPHSMDPVKDIDSTDLVKHPNSNIPTKISNNSSSINDTVMKNINSGDFAKTPNIPSIRILTKEQINRKTIHVQEISGRSVTMDDLTKSPKFLESSGSHVINSNRGFRSAPNLLNKNNIIDFNTDVCSDNNNSLNASSSSNVSLLSSTPVGQKLTMEEKKSRKEDLDRYKVDVNTELECLANLSLGEQKNQLLDGEKGLVMKRHSVLKQLDLMSRDLKYWEAERNIQAILAAEAKMLREQLMQAEAKLLAQKNKVNGIGSKVSATQKIINEGRRECFRLSKICAGLGIRVIGPDYKVPEVHAKCLQKRVKEIAAHSRKLAQKPALKIDSLSRPPSVEINSVPLNIAPVRDLQLQDNVLMDVPHNSNVENTFSEPLVIVIDDDNNYCHEKVPTTPCCTYSNEFELIDLAAHDGQIMPKLNKDNESNEKTLTPSPIVVSSVEGHSQSPSNKRLNPMFERGQYTDMKTSRESLGAIQKNSQIKSMSMSNKQVEIILDENSISPTTRIYDDKVEKESSKCKNDIVNNESRETLSKRISTQKNDNLLNQSDDAISTELGQNDTFSKTLHISVHLNQINDNQTDKIPVKQHATSQCNKTINEELQTNHTAHDSANIEKRYHLEKDNNLHVDLEKEVNSEISIGNTNCAVSEIVDNALSSNQNTSKETISCEKKSGQGLKLTEVDELSKVQSNKIRSSTIKYNSTRRADVQPYESILKHFHAPRSNKTDGILCPYDLMGTCSDSDCQFIHPSTSHCR